MSSVIIPARYGSTRFPGKLLKNLDNIPIIVSVVNRCLESKANNVYVAADDKRIAEALKDTGVQVIMTPPSIPTGTDRIATVAANLDDEVIINVQGDEPFIAPELINQLINNLENNLDINMNTACTEFENIDDVNNPSHVKVVLDKYDYALYFSRFPIPFDRDGASVVKRYRHIGIYGYRKKFLLKYVSLPQTPLEAAENLEQLRALESGEKIKVIKTNYKPISIDTPEDLKKAEEYIKSC